MQGYHSSVLLKEAIDALMPIRQSQDGLTLADKNNWYLDCTLGDGGHSLEILKRGGRVLGIDADPEALKRTKDRLGSLGFLGKVKLIQGNFRDIKNLVSSLAGTDFKGYTLKFSGRQDKQTTLKDQNLAGVKSNLAGAIFDLGVSSLQLETSQRGFSFGKKGPLDMRMDPSLQIQALDLINNLSRKELYEIFDKLGEEKHSWGLAGAVVRAREVKPFKTTDDLAEMVTREFGGVRGKVHPATRVFQALRMIVNDELGALQEGLKEVKDLIQNGGRIVVISFHSLEDRIVKSTFREWEAQGLGQILTKKPVVPSDDEIRENPRARSAKMRIFEANRYDNY